MTIIFLLCWVGVEVLTPPRRERKPLDHAALMGLRVLVAVDVIYWSLLALFAVAAA